MYYDTGNYHNLYLFMDYRPYFRKKEFACRLDEILFWAFLHGLPVDFQPDSSQPRYVDFVYKTVLKDGEGRSKQRCEMLEF